MYRVEFVLRGEIAYEADVDLPILEDEELEQASQITSKTKGRKPVKKQPAASVVTPAATSKNNKNKKAQQPPAVQAPAKRTSGRAARKKKGQDYDQLEEESDKGYKDEYPSKKLKKGKKQVVESEQDDDEDDEEGEDLQGSEDEAKLLELEGELEEELAHLGEDGEDVDNFDEDDENEELEKLERYAQSERPMTKLLQSQKYKDLENLSDSNLSEDPNYQKLTKRQKNIVKNNMTGQIETELLQLPNQTSRKKNKNVSEEDVLKKIEKEEKRRAQMQKQMEDLKRQTVDKILNEAGTKQKKRKEKEEQEKDNKVNHQYRKLPNNEPRIRILNNLQGSIVTITKTQFHPILNPQPQLLFDNNMMSNLQNQINENNEQNNDNQNHKQNGDSKITNNQLVTEVF